ncbi:MAG: adenylate kinase [Acidimicrobiaceae bacterium]|nr:adenylate kinase [Acidimicrobiaceae bacterium]
MLRALLLAPPGAGKGTQGERISEAAGVPHIATGDLLRTHVAQDTELGRTAREFMQRGELVPDSLVLELVYGTLAEPKPRRGFVLDGFPRTLAQAEGAFSWAKRVSRTFHAVITLDVPQPELVRRLLERGRSEGRDDDTEDTICHRLDVYESETQPLLEFYRARDILVPVDGTGTVDEVTDRIMTALGPLAPFV